MAKPKPDQKSIPVSAIILARNYERASREALLNGARSVGSRSALDPDHVRFEAAFHEEKRAKKFRSWLSKYSVADEE